MISHSDISTKIDLSLAASIRHARKADLTLLEWDEEMWRYRDLFRKAFDDSVEGHRLMLIADVNQYPVGRLNVQLTAGNLSYADGFSRAYLYSLHVMPPFRGQGIGTHLIRTAENELVDRAFGWATIAVATNNRDALRLYERLGYHIFRQDDSDWSFSDPSGQQHFVHEACFALEKRLSISPASPSFD